MSLGGNLRVHIANTRRDVTDAFNQESLPPYVIIAMVGVSCLSRRQTKGIKSWNVGRVVPKGRPRLVNDIESTAHPKILAKFAMEDVSRLIRINVDLWKLILRPIKEA